MCSHDPFFGTNKNRILKNGSCEWALRQMLSPGSHSGLKSVLSAFCSTRIYTGKYSKRQLNSVRCKLSMTEISV